MLQNAFREKYPFGYKELDFFYHFRQILKKLINQHIHLLITEKVETIEPMSKSRKQAYLDLEVEYAEDLWPDLPVDEDPNAETIAAIQEIEEIERNPEK